MIAERLARIRALRREVVTSVKVRFRVFRRASVTMLDGRGVAPLAACKASSASRDAAARGGAAAEAREVQVVPATEDRLVRAITVTGTLAAEEQVTLSMKVTGRLQGPVRRPGQPRDPRPGAGAPGAHRLQPARKPGRSGAAAGARAPGPAGRRATTTAIDPEKTSMVRSAQALLDEARLTRERTADVRRAGHLAARPRSIRPTPSLQGRRQPLPGRARRGAQPAGGARAAAHRTRAGAAGRARLLAHLAARRHGPRAPRHRGPVPGRRLAGRDDRARCTRCACGSPCPSATRRPCG